MDEYWNYDDELMHKAVKRAWDVFPMYIASWFEAVLIERHTLPSLREHQYKLAMSILEAAEI